MHMKSLLYGIYIWFDGPVGIMCGPLPLCYRRRSLPMRFRKYSGRREMAVRIANALLPVARAAGVRAAERSCAARVLGVRVALAMAGSRGESCPMRGRSDK